MCQAAVKVAEIVLRQRPIVTLTRCAVLRAVKSMMIALMRVKSVSLVDVVLEDVHEIISAALEKCVISSQADV